MSEQSNYTDLSPDEKIRIGIEFTARGVEMPRYIKEFLISINLYDVIINPTGE